MAERKQPTEQDLQMEVLLRQYCRSAEENEVLYEELDDIREAFGVVLQENASLRFQLATFGVALPESVFTIDDEEPEPPTQKLLLPSPTPLADRNA